jgi:alpha-N-acetylglucosamine transferase
MTSKGYLVLAQGGYSSMAEILAESIRKTQTKISNISIITDEVIDSTLFDKVIQIPQDDLAKDNGWKIHNRVYFYDLSPYDETVILDADMLFLSDVSHWWNLFNFYDILITENVLTYRGEKVIDSPYRKTFNANNLPNCYSAFTYFKKCKKAKDFFDLLKIIISNWDDWTMRYAPEFRQKFPSIDLAMAISAKIMGIEEEIFSKFDYPTFTHMKTGCQNWKQALSHKNWSDIVSLSQSPQGIKIGGYLQQGILHYVEKDLL